jgi:hypothetical protein
MDYQDILNKLSQSYKDVSNPNASAIQQTAVGANSGLLGLGTLADKGLLPQMVQGFAKNPQQNPLMELSRNIVFGDNKKREDIQNALIRVKAGKGSQEDKKMLTDTGMDANINLAMSMVSPKVSKTDKELMAIRKTVENTPIDEIVEQMVKSGTLNYGKGGTMSPGQSNKYMEESIRLLNDMIRNVK